MSSGPDKQSFLKFVYDFYAGMKTFEVTLVYEGDTFDLVNIAITQTAIIVNSTPNVVVTVIVTLNTPLDQTEYDALAEKDITFTLAFTATQP